MCTPALEALSNGHRRSQGWKSSMRQQVKSFVLKHKPPEANASSFNAIGLVRAPLATTLMQVASRYLLVWGIVHNFPNVTARASPAYSSMLVAWSVTEVIRYSYFAVNMAYGRVPGWMTWLRYNTFFVLYPLGISSECWLVWKATLPAKNWNPNLEGILWVVLLVYIPGESYARS